MIPAVSVDAYQAARRHVASIDRSDRGRIVVSGADRASYLQGLLTNDVAALGAGSGCYAAYLTPQGRMIADLFVYELGDVMLVTMARDVKDTVIGKFDQFIFTEDVQLGDVTGSFAQIAVVGPDAADVLSAVIDGVDRASLASLVEHGNVRAQVGGQPAIVTRVTDTGEPGFDVYVDQARAAAFRSALAAQAVVALDADTADVLRIEAGVPQFHRDLDEDTIPLEAGIESRAISFTKGCYVGQEVIIRVLHRGHGRVARKLVGLVLDGGAAPPAGTAIMADAREIGRVTSSTLSPALGKPIALGYVHRDFIATDTAVSIGGVRAVVTALPFTPSAARPAVSAVE
jgi:folate-binding protein YgfZ